MLLGIDHIVVAVRDPDAASREIEVRCGLRAGEGGRHPALGTFNRLIWFGDSYLELIGVFDAELAARSWIGPSVLAALARGGGLATWAVATDDLHGLVPRLRSNAPDVAGPIDGERSRPDGRIVRWRLAIPGELGPDRAPFLIEHDTGAAEWTDEERRGRAAAEHPAGGLVRIEALELAVREPSELGSDIAGLLGLEVRDGGAGRVEIPIGGQRIVLRPPDAPPVLRLRVEADVAARTVTVAGCRFELRGRTAAAP